MATVLRAAVEDRRRILEGARLRPYFAASCRGYDDNHVRKVRLNQIESQLDDLLDHSDVDVLVSNTGWIIVQHGLVETVTGQPLALIREPSWIDRDLLEEAARLARARGALRLGIDVFVQDEVEQTALAAAGFEAEYQRVLRRVPSRLPASAPARGQATGEVDASDPVARAETDGGTETPTVGAETDGGTRGSAPGRQNLLLSRNGVNVYRASEDDRVFLLALSTRCVPFMFCESRQGDLPLVRRRFFDVYATLDLSGKPDFQVLVATVNGEPAGAVMYAARSSQGLDKRDEAYIYDVSVEPERWGRSVAAALIQACIEELDRCGIEYLGGDVAVDNARVLALAQRFGFVVEHRRHYRRLDGSADV